jgi:tRNA uridine 5-carbamoylmethylation protein Kti12
MEIIIFCGPPGSGKTTLSRTFGSKYVRISQDELGKEGHLIVLTNALNAGHNIIIDRMSFSKEQRSRYIEPAKKAGYKCYIKVLHENFDTCLERMKKRENHPTIKDEKTARKVLNFFYSKYERPTPDEADEIEFKYPEGEKPLAVICDLDGTLCNIDHRLHFVHPPEGQKKDWRSFSESLRTDTVNKWCRDILSGIIHPIYDSPEIVLCSGRADNYKSLTEDWLKENFIQYNHLFMRRRDDYRKDDIVKEVILDFEILTRYKPYFFIDDRKSVVDMWRKRGYTCLQCAPGAF